MVANIPGRNSISTNRTLCVMDYLLSSILKPLRRWLDDIEIHSPKLALFLYRIIPAQCPFERNVQFCGRTILRIPPLCKLNPLYDQVVGLRFRAMCYLVDECGMAL